MHAFTFVCFRFMLGPVVEQVVTEKHTGHSRRHPSSDGCGRYVSHGSEPNTKWKVLFKTVYSHSPLECSGLLWGALGCSGQPNILRGIMIFKLQTKEYQKLLRKSEDTHKKNKSDEATTTTQHTKTIIRTHKKTVVKPTKHNT